MNTRKLLVSVLVLVSVLLSACAPAATPSIPTVVPPTAIPPTVAPTVAPTKGPTTFSSKKFGLPMNISFGPEWHVVEDFADEILLVGGTQAYEGVELVFTLVKDAKIANPGSTTTMPWPDDFIAYLHSNQYLGVGQSTPITVSGINGVQIDVSVKNIGQKRTFIALKSTNWLYLDYDQNWRFIILDDINGQRLLIGTTETPEGFSLATELAQKVIDSVVFTN